MTNIILLLVLAGNLSAQSAKQRLQPSLEKFQRSGQLAQQGKFAEAQPLMNEALAEIDTVVLADPANPELRLIRGSLYARFPAFLNKSAAAREDLEIAVRDPQYKEAAEKALAALTKTAKPERFSQIRSDASPLIAVASVTLPGKSVNSRDQLPPVIAKLMREIETYQGFLGSHVLTSADQPGMILLFTWWKDKQSLAAWVDGAAHKAAIQEIYSKPASASPSSTQVAMELLLPLPGGMQFNGGLAPKRVSIESGSRMKTLRYWLHWERAPSLEQLPWALFRAAVSGLITGIPIGIIMLLIFAPQHVDSLLHPLYWLLMPLIGSFFSVSFYITCALPQHYFTSISSGWPIGRVRFIRALLGAAGSVAGVLLAMSAIRVFLPIRIINSDQMNRMLAVDAILGAALALLIGAWVQKDIREKHLRFAASQAQAQALQAQIQPHFFFNTMNTIQALIDTDAPEAKRVIARLSGMFRYALASGQNPTVPLSDEIQFVRDYLEIEQVRFGDRLRFHLPAPESESRVPSLILQPLVENAVRHGIARRIDGGEVSVSFERRNGAQHIRVTNPVDRLPTFDDATLFNPGHALDNIRRRLDLLYGQRARLTIQPDGDNAVAVTLEIPCES